MYNKATLIGRLGQDPDIRTTQSGNKVAQLSLATSERWKDKQTGEKREKTEWHRVTVWGDGLAGVAERFLKKGSLVMVEGKIQTRKWQDQSGADRYTTEIVVSGFDCKLVMLESAGGSGPRGADSPDDYGSGDSYDSRPASSTPNGAGHGAGQKQSGFDLDDEIPF